MCLICAQYVLQFHLVNYLTHAVCFLASLTLLSALTSAFVFLPCSNLLSFAVFCCPACPPCASARAFSASVCILIPSMASSKVGILRPCFLACANLWILVCLPRSADLTSFNNRSLMRCSSSCAWERTGGRFSTGSPKGATMDVTTW